MDRDDKIALLEGVIRVIDTYGHCRTGGYGGEDRGFCLAGAAIKHLEPAVSHATTASYYAFSTGINRVGDALGLDPADTYVLSDDTPWSELKPQIEARIQELKASG